jgi:HK97 family phage major capsid protein/HK97 family phage prohead protease
MELTRAYSFLTIKAIDGDRRRIRGIATTPTPDRQGDILEPLGARFPPELPLLLHHRKDCPVGIARLGPAGPGGIPFEAEIPIVTVPGPVKDETDRAWQSITHGLIKAVSIGFRVFAGSLQRIKGSDGFRILTSEILEISLVTIPANQDATLEIVKSIDASYLAAIGRSSSRPGVAGCVQCEGTTMQTTAEQITAWENKRAALVAQMAAIMQKAADEHRTLDAAETDTYETLEREMIGVDNHLPKLRTLEQSQIKAAAPVNGHNGITRPASVQVFTTKPTLPPGTMFTRAAMAIAASKGVRSDAIEYAKRWEAETPEVIQFLKAAVAPGTTTDPAWAQPLTAVSNIAGEFLALLRPATILGKIANLRQVPFNTSVPTQTAGGSYGWVGEAKPKPVTKLGFGTAKLDMSKAAGIIVLTEELVRTSNPSAESIVRADMIAGIAAFLDVQFINPAVAAVAGVNPASITNGITAIPATVPADPEQDIKLLLKALATGNIPLAGVTLIMSEVNAVGLTFARDATGTLLYPGMSATGGTMHGMSVVTSNAANNWIIGLQPQAILYADDGGVSIDVSREASLQMDSAPTAVPDATTVLVSLWQNNLVGLRAERFVNWKRAIDAGVQYVNGADYAA